MKFHLERDRLNEKTLFFQAGIQALLCPFLLLFLSSLVNPVFAQASANLPTFHPIAEHSYGIKEGLPEECVSKILVDKNQRIHLASCTVALTVGNSYLYQYDGIRTYPVALRLKYKPLRIRFDGVDAANRIFGHSVYNYKAGMRGKEVYTYDQVTKRTESFDLNEMGIRLIGDVVSCEEDLFFLGRYDNQRRHEIFKIRNDEITSVSQLDFSLEGGQLSVTDEDYWVATTAKSVYRISKKDGTPYSYPFPGKSDYHSVTMLPHQGNIWMLLNIKRVDLTSYSKALYLWNAETNSLIANPYKPADWDDDEIASTKITKDAKGNLLVVYWSKSQEVSATLLDEQQNVYDYTPVISENTSVVVTSSDFKQSIIHYSRSSPVRYVEVATHGTIKRVTGIFNPRGMLELNARTISLGGRGLFYDGGEWRISEDDSYLSLTWNDSEKVKDKEGCFWFNQRFPDAKARVKLMRYDPVQERCDTFDLGFYPKRFDVTGDGSVVFATDKALYKWSPEAGPPQLLAEGILKQHPNQVFVGQDSIIWVATSQGLVRIDAQTGIPKKINLISGQTTSVVRIHQDARGRLWLGTIANGLIIYDPVSGDRQVIERANGLSHNTVVSFLEDEDGDIWAGTFYGITVLSQDGSVIGTLYEENGLANNECNRWSALKMKDGRLCFGAVDGVSIIDPIAWKAALENHSPPAIHLTRIYSDLEDEAILKKDHLSSFEQKKRIVLPANNRNLNVSFQLSNLASPEKNTFAYRIEGLDKEWRSIGNQRQLALNALPTGSYFISIKGKGPRGKWSTSPIVIPLEVSTFFYEKWWFFVLCTLPFVLFFLLWQHRQRGERKRLEVEVEDRTATVRAQADKLREADQMKSRLYTNITHEFRTPLTVISGMTDLIDEDPGTAKKLINRNSKGLLRLVNQMLDLAKLASGHLQLELIQADAIPYIQYLFESFQSFAAGKSIQLFFQKEVEEIVMDFDERKLESIVANLLSNAIKFTPEGGEVKLQVEVGNMPSMQTEGPTTDYLQLRVSDNGIGISPEKLPFIFDRFYQVDDSTTRKGEGTGIGLTLSQELVEMMGGTIQVQSPGPGGQGTSFLVSLPIRKEANISHQPVEATQLLPLPTSAEILPQPLSKVAKKEELPLLLLIEDNTDVAIYIQSCLKNRYTVEWAVNGAIGIEKALQTIPDVIISDVMMPEKDGYEVCLALKNDERTSHIPIVLLTAKADVDSRLEGLGVGADAYLSKPFLKEELYIRLEQLVALRRRLQERYTALNLQGTLDNNEDQQQPSHEPTLEDVFLQKIHDLVIENLDDANFGYDQIAQQLLLSQSQLFRKVKALTGQSVSNHIRRIRLHRGKELLLNSQLTVAEIAYNTGFTSPSYFSRSFSKEFGKSPMSARK